MTSQFFTERRMDRVRLNRDYDFDSSRKRPCMGLSRDTKMFVVKGFISQSGVIDIAEKMAGVAAGVFL